MELEYRVILALRSVAVFEDVEGIAPVSGSAPGVADGVFRVWVHLHSTIQQRRAVSQPINQTKGWTRISVVTIIVPNRKEQGGRQESKGKPARTLSMTRLTSSSKKNWPTCDSLPALNVPFGSGVH
jgi:hypothetical protein